MWNKKIISTYLIFTVIYGISFLLYRLPPGAVVYPFILCTVATLLFLLRDYYKRKKKNELLKKILENADYALNQLPEPVDTVEEAYQILLVQLQELLAKKETDDEVKQNETIEYYTLWVHQIKTPIASLKLLFENEDSEKARKTLIQLGRIEQYVEMVLTYLRLEQSASDYVLKEYDLDDLLRKVIRKNSQEFIARKLVLDYQPAEKKIITDEKWFLFVIEQVLSNALKYTKEGKITISAAEEELIISDTGIGIAPEDLPRIFEKGYTGYNGRKDLHASGIGLYLCKRICGKLGLSIKAQSVTGKGTAIRIGLKQTKHDCRD